MRISDWSSDVCSSDLSELSHQLSVGRLHHEGLSAVRTSVERRADRGANHGFRQRLTSRCDLVVCVDQLRSRSEPASDRSEEHTSELQSLMRNSYAVFCLKKKKTYIRHRDTQCHLL